MRFSCRFHFALVLVLAAAACSRPVDDTTSAAQPQPGTATPNASAPAEKAGNPAATVPVERHDARVAAASNQPSTPRPTPPRIPATATAPPAPAPVPADVPAPPAVKIPAGTTLSVTMIDAVGTDTNKAGDTFTASLAEPVVINGKTALEKGAKVQGRIESLDEPGRVKGRAAMSLVLTQLTRKDKAYKIDTQPFTAQAESGTKKDALKVGGGAALGALVGALAGGKKGAAVGAAVGGGAGTTVVLATKGDQLKIDSETKVNFVLKDDIDLK